MARQGDRAIRDDWCTPKRTNSGSGAGAVTVGCGTAGGAEHTSSWRAIRVLLLIPTRTGELHPCDRGASHRRLRGSGHEVTVQDLYAEGFRAAMCPAEGATAYHERPALFDPLAGAHRRP